MPPGSLRSGGGGARGRMFFPPPRAPGAVPAIPPIRSALNNAPATPGRPVPVGSGHYDLGSSLRTFENLLGDWSPERKAEAIYQHYGQRVEPSALRRGEVRSNIELRRRSSTPVDVAPSGEGPVRHRIGPFFLRGGHGNVRGRSRPPPHQLVAANDASTWSLAVLRRVRVGSGDTQQAESDDCQHDAPPCERGVCVVEQHGHHRHRQVIALRSLSSYPILGLMRIFRITTLRPDILVRWTRNEQDARAVRKWMSEADPHASIELVQFELTEEGVLALLNTIGTIGGSVAGGPCGDVDPRWRPIIRRA
jgi:hypothetical protein